MFFNKFPKTGYDFYGDKRLTTIPNIFRQIRVRDAKFDDIKVYQKYTITEERPDQLSYKLYGTTDYYWTFFIVNDHLNSYSDWPMGYQQLLDFIDEKYPNKVIRLYRDVEDPVDYNSIASKYSIGKTMVGQTSGATAEIIARDIDTNQLTFKYLNNSVFTENEEIAVGLERIVDKFDIRDEKNAIHHFVDADNNLINNYDNLYAASSFVTNSDYEKEVNENNSSISVLRDSFVEEFGILFRRLMNG